MKVNKLEEQRTTCIEELLVGQTFTTSRTGNVKNGSRLLMGYYMKVDKSSGISVGLRQSEDLAVNLETGQLRKFDKGFRVTEISVECNVVND